MTIKFTPDQILEKIYDRAESCQETTVILDRVIGERVDYVCRCTSNRAGVRLLMSCLLGKLDNPSVDPRNPYKRLN